MSATALPRIQVSIPEGLEDVTPAYLETKKRELSQYHVWVSEKNFSEIEKASHKLKGTAGGYGFEALGQYARDLNLAAKGHDLRGIDSVLHSMAEYLAHVELVNEKV